MTDLERRIHDAITGNVFVYAYEDYNSYGEPCPVAEMEDVEYAVKDIIKIIDEDPALMLVQAIWTILDGVDGSEAWVHDYVDNAIKSWRACKQ